MTAVSRPIAEWIGLICYYEGKKFEDIKDWYMDDMRLMSKLTVTFKNGEEFSLRFNTPVIVVWEGDPQSIN